MPSKIQPFSAAIGTAIFFLLFRLWASNSYGLTTDEAHYILYGLFPAAGYVDHPPMTGWLNVFILFFAEPSQAFAFRIIPGILHFLALFMLIGTVSRHTSNPHAITLTVFLFEFGVIYQALAFGLVPDTLLITGVLVWLWFLEKLNETSNPRYLAGIAAVAGLMVLSKYTAVLFFAGILPFIFRKEFFFNRWLWISLAIFLLIVSPNLIWLVENDFVSFVYQSERIITGSTAEFHKPFLIILAALLLFSPFLIIFIFPGIYKQFNIPLYVPLSILPYLAFLLYSSIFKKALPHWYAPLFVPLIPYIALWLIKSGMPNRLFGKITRAAGLLVPLSLTLCLFVFLVLPLNSGLLSQDPRWEVKGWDELGEKLRSIGPEKPVFTSNWTYVSRMKVYLGESPVWDINEYNPQFEIWFGKPEKGQDGLLAVPQFDYDFIPDYLKRFKSCDEQGEFGFPVENPIAFYKIFSCRGYLPRSAG